MVDGVPANAVMRGHARARLWVANVWKGADWVSDLQSRLLYRVRGVEGLVV